MTPMSSDPPLGPSVPGQPARRFRETVLASGLVTVGQMEACEAHVAHALGTAISADESRWDAECAKHLVKQGAITRFQAGTLLAGRSKLTLGQYEIVEELGRGGMGQVFRARHALMGRTVAIKVLPRAKSTPESEAAFQREIRMLARLDHENLVRALDAGHDGKVYYLVTEFVPGLNLRQQVSRHGPLDETAAVSVISQAAKGLSYAHGQGLVHRDIKPSNLLVSPDGRVKVLDLGLAGSVFEDEATRLGRVVGTLDYMAPEQIREPDTVGPQADIYALGCTLYFALTGRVPFPGGTRREKVKRQLSEQPPPIQVVRPGVDAPLCRAIEAMMRKDPHERPPTAQAVIELLGAWTPPRPVPMPRIEKRRLSAVGGAAGGPLDAAGSSVDQGSFDASHASQQATSSGDAVADDTWRSRRSVVERPHQPSTWRKIERAGAVGVRHLAVAAAVGLLVVAAMRSIGLVGPGGGAMLGWGAFGLVIAWRLRPAFMASPWRRTR